MARLCLLAVAPLAALPAHATVMVEVPLPQMVARADAIVQGEVMRTGVQVAVVGGRLEPRTHTWIRVRRWIKGDAPSETVEVIEPGGALPGKSLEVQVLGVPRYQVGEEVLVFLRASPDRAGAFRTMELAQGKFRVRAAGDARFGKLVTRDFGDVAFASWTDGQMQVRPKSEPALPLEDMVAHIRRLLAKRPGTILPAPGGP